MSASCQHRARIHVTHRGQSVVITDCPHARFRHVTCAWCVLPAGAVTRERLMLTNNAHERRMRMRAQVFLLQEGHSGDAQAACQPLVRPFRRATAPSRNPGKHGFWGPRPGPESGLGWASALLGYTLGVYLTPRHPSSHATSRACAHDTHFMPCCMRCLHALRGRPVHTRIAPPRAPGRCCRMHAPLIGSF